MAQGFNLVTGRMVVPAQFMNLLPWCPVREEQARPSSGCHPSSRTWSPGGARLAAGDRARQAGGTLLGAQSRKVSRCCRVKCFHDIAPAFAGDWLWKLGILFGWSFLTNILFFINMLTSLLAFLLVLLLTNFQFCLFCFFLTINLTWIFIYLDFFNLSNIFIFSTVVLRLLWFLF